MVRWPEYEPIPFARWKVENPELCSEEPCGDCYGEGDAPVNCKCECGDVHQSTRKCESCNGTGTYDAGGLFAYENQLHEDRQRWEQHFFETYGPQDVFVFGSNREGRHGKGAAKRAVEAWGAKYGQEEGRQGRAYAIVTKELRRHSLPPVSIADVAVGVHKFLEYARNHPRERFLVTRIGGGLAGFDWERQVLPLFDGRPENVELLEGRRV